MKAKNQNGIDTCCCATFVFYPQTNKEAILHNMSKQFDIEIDMWPYGNQYDTSIVVELTGKYENINAAAAWAMSMGVRIEMVNET